jgi:hypothetical protein
MSPAVTSKSLTLDSAVLLQQASQAGRQGSALLIKHPALPWPEASCVERNQQSFGRAVHLSQGVGTERYSGLHCRSEELPFMEACFKQVALWHVIAAGEEAELAEACRVLAPGGELLLVGLNSSGLRARRDKEAKDLPRLQRHALELLLPQLGMEVVAVSGAGLLGVPSRAFQRNGLGTLLLLMADLVVIRAQAVNPPSVSPLRLKQFQAGVAPTA